MRTILLISPYWKEPHRWMASSLKLAELWQRLGYRVVVCCMGSVSSIEDVSATLRIHRRKDFFLKDPLNFGIALGFSRYVRGIIAEEKPALVVCNKVLFWTSFCIPLLWLSGQKVILLTDALVGITWQPRGMIPRIIMSIGAWTMGWIVLLAAKKIIFFHPQPEHILRRLGIVKKSRVIPTGIDLTPFPIRSLDSIQDHAPVTLTYVGRLESVKGVDDVLAAAVPLKKEYPHLRIKIVGWYKAEHPLVEQYKNDVEFTGLAENVLDHLSKTDIFVLPSYSEGLSNALMEAMASTCACIASEVGGNTYLIQNGISGFLFPPGDREALRSHIRRLLDDPHKRRAMAMSAKSRIEAIFSWDIVGKKYQELFLEPL